MNPTETEIKEFWEWCGIKYHPQRNHFSGEPHYHEEYYADSTGRKIEYPPIDLNSLWKYAIPQLCKE